MRGLKNKLFPTGSLAEANARFHDASGADIYGFSNGNMFVEACVDGITMSQVWRACDF